VTGLVAFAAALAAFDAVAAAPADGGRFRPLAVYVDAGDASIAAYQIEITVGDAKPSAKIVGVEGGEVDPFGAAPYYDPAALQGGRIVIAAFTVDANPPRGRIRVATLHLFEPAGCVPVYRARLMAAVAMDGGERHAQVTLEPGGSAP
jgi:hypothetical protein